MTTRRSSDAGATRVCLTRCPLPAAPLERVHCLPCRIRFDGKAPVKTYFRPEPLRAASSSGATASATATATATATAGRTSDTADAAAETAETAETAAAAVATTQTPPTRLRAEFRGVQLHGETLDLRAIGYQGLVLEDAGMTHPDAGGRVWEVDHHFDSFTYWDVPSSNSDEKLHLPTTLRHWTQLAHAIHCDDDIDGGIE